MAIDIHIVVFVLHPLQHAVYNNECTTTAHTYVYACVGERVGRGGGGGGGGGGIKHIECLSSLRQLFPELKGTLGS